MKWFQKWNEVRISHHTVYSSNRTSAFFEELLGDSSCGQHSAFTKMRCNRYNLEVSRDFPIKNNISFK